MNIKEIIELVPDHEAYNWTTEAVIGTALILKGGSVDSLGQQLSSELFYVVGKHRTSGRVAILPTPRNAKHEFANTVLKRKNRFN